MDKRDSKPLTMFQLFLTEFFKSERTMLTIDCNNLSEQDSLKFFEQILYICHDKVYYEFTERNCLIIKKSLC